MAKRKQVLSDYREKTSEELKALLLESKKEMLKALSELTAGREKNFKKAKNLRFQVAQISTIIREKEIVESLNN